MSSCESTKIATSCWTTMTGGPWNPPKKYPTSKDKEEAAARWQEGCNHNKIKFHTHRVLCLANILLLLPFPRGGCSPCLLLFFYLVNEQVLTVSPGTGIGLVNIQSHSGVKYNSYSNTSRYTWKHCRCHAMAPTLDSFYPLHWVSLSPSLHLLSL